MSLHFFSIPALLPQAAQDEFNAFYALYRVVQPPLVPELDEACRVDARCTPMDQMPHPVLRLAAGRRQPNRKAPGVLVGRRVDARRQRLPGKPPGLG